MRYELNPFFNGAGKASECFCSTVSLRRVYMGQSIRYSY